MGKNKSFVASNLAGLKNLKGLAIHNADIHNLDFLLGLNRLETVSVTGSKALTNIDSVASLNCLTHLRIENCRQMRGFAEVISHLNLDSCVIVGSANKEEESVVTRLN